MWGDTVNLASRMESIGAVGKTQVSTWTGAPKMVTLRVAL